MEKQKNVNGVSYWRGTVDTRLESLDEKADYLIEKIDSMAKQQNEDKGKFVEWEYIRDKFTVPVILATIVFFLFTIMPAALVVIYK